MKLVVNKEEFTRELAFVSDVIDSKNTNTKQVGLLFEAEGDKLTLTATSGNAVAISSVKLEIPVTELFYAVSDVRKLVGVLPLLSNQTVNLNFTDSKLTVTAGSNKRYSFAIFAEDVRPHIKSFSTVTIEDETVMVNAKAFINGLLNANPFTAKKEENQYILTNVGVSLTPTQLNFYAMDGNRAFYQLLEDAADDCVSRNMIIKISNSYANLLSRMDVVERMAITRMDGDSAYRFTAGQRIAYIKVNVGQLPDIAKTMIPKAKNKLTKHIYIDVSELQQMVQRIRMVADAKYKKMLFNSADSVLQVRSRHHEAELMEFEEEVGIQGGDNGEFTTDGNYVFDFLSKTKDKVTISFGETLKDPVLIQDSHGMHYLVSQVG